MSEKMNMDGFEDCIVGNAERFNMDPVFCYDYDKVITKMVKSGMTEEQAVEYYEYNMLGAWVGEGTPVFLRGKDEF